MDGSRAHDTASVIQYQRKRKQVKDLETEYESRKKCGKQNLEQANLVERERFAQMQRDVQEFKRECMFMEETANSFIKANESLRRELDSTREELKNLQKCHEEAVMKHEAADLKYKADVRLLMKEIKSLRSSQSELRQELYRVEKERTPLWLQRSKASSVLDIIGLNCLPDDVLIAILSLMTLMEAVRTSVLSRRWRHLWMFTSGSLDFDAYKIRAGCLMEANEVITQVDHLIELHQGLRLDTFCVRFFNGGVYGNSIPRWIHFAMQKEVKKFELELGYPNRLGSHNNFPELKKLLSLKCAFGSLRSLKFERANITDEVVHYLLASCSNLEHLSITRSSSTRNLQIVDPIPNLKELEISDCSSLESLKVSAASIVSFSFKELEQKNNKLLFENIPNLRELTLKSCSATSFIYEYEDNKHACYSVQLVKLSLKLSPVKYTWADPYNLPLLYSLKRLELSTVCRVGQSLLFFTLLIKAAPILREFRIKVNYSYNPYELDNLIPFPDISEAEAPIFHHENLKLVEVVGYVGCPSEEEFLLRLFKVAPSLEKVVIEVKSKHFGCRWKYYYCKNLRIRAQTVKEAKERAKHLQSVFPPKSELVVR